MRIASSADSPASSTALNSESSTRPTTAAISVFDGISRISAVIPRSSGTIFSMRSAVDFVVDLPQRPLDGTSHGDRISRAHLAQVEGALGRRGGVRRFFCAQPEFLQRGGKILARNSLLHREN